MKPGSASSNSKATCARIRNRKVMTHNDIAEWFPTILHERHRPEHRSFENKSDCTLQDSTQSKRISWWSRLSAAFGNVEVALHCITAAWALFAILRSFFPRLYLVSVLYVLSLCFLCVFDEKAALSLPDGVLCHLESPIERIQKEGEASERLGGAQAYAH